MKTLWQFAHERHDIFLRRVAGEPPPWTDDPIMQSARFTNIFRAADRFSQFMIQEVFREGWSHDDAFVCVMLARHFNLPYSWRVIEELAATNPEEYGPEMGLDVWWGEFSAFAEALSARMLEEREAGKSVYSHAYIVPATGPEFWGHPRWDGWFHTLDQMLQDSLPTRIKWLPASSVLKHLRSYKQMGAFITYQIYADLCYTDLWPWNDSSALIPGVGAVRGASARAEMTLNERGAYDWIYQAWEEQNEQSWDETGREAPLLWGHELSLMDVQNIHCEYGKYVKAAGGGHIKRRYDQIGESMKFKFPASWGVNIPEELRA